jgi:cobalt-zinc-cadmium efflux system outer membrane protein
MSDQMRSFMEAEVPAYSFWRIGVPTSTISFPLPVWDRNKGAIIAAEAALVTASEEPHLHELALTNTLATNYLGYKTNLESLEYYRRFILPDQVRYYRGVYDRRRVDPNSAFGDLVQAQQTLASNVSTYLGILSSLWTSVISVADMMQTDDLFQLGTPHELPELPDLDHLRPWLCIHPCIGLACANGACGPLGPLVPMPVIAQTLPQALNPAAVKGQAPALPQVLNPAPAAPLAGQSQPANPAAAAAPPSSGQPRLLNRPSPYGQTLPLQPVNPPQPQALLPIQIPGTLPGPAPTSPPEM